MKVLKRVNIVRLEIDLNSIKSIDNAIEMLSDAYHELVPNSDDHQDMSELVNNYNKIQLIKAVRSYAKSCIEKHIDGHENPAGLKMSKEFVERLIDAAND